MPEDEFIQINLELLTTDAVVSADQLLLHVADCPAKGTTDFAPLRSSIGRGWMRGTCLKPASCDPVKLLRPSVYTIEPTSRFSFKKATSVGLLKSDITLIRARPVARPRFSTAARTNAALRSLS